MTDVALKEYLERLIGGKVDRIDVELKGLRTATEAAFLASQKAIDKAEEALTRRLEGMNEIREQLRDQAETFARQEVVTTENRARDVRITKLEGVQSRLLGGLVIAPFVAAIVSGLVVYALTH